MGHRFGYNLARSHHNVTYGFWTAYGAWATVAR